MTVGEEKSLLLLMTRLKSDRQTHSRTGPSRCLDLSIYSPSRPKTGPLWTSPQTSPTDGPGTGGGRLGALIA